VLDPELEDCLPYLYYLLGIVEPDSPLVQMDARLRRRRTLESIRRLLVRESRDAPLVLVFEDLQWLDSETGAFLNFVVEGLPGTHILLLLNYRPEYRHSWQGLGYFSELHLQPLAQREAEALLEALLGTDSSLASLKTLIRAQTQGNPFFLEEVVQTLVEEKVLSGELGHYRLERGLESLRIPTTVQGVLCARMDRLAAAEKELLQTLAVIGKEFPWSLLRQVVTLPEDEMRRLLARLQAGDFLYERPAFPEIEYTFKHALTQEVAYNSLLRERRGALHERTARAIETLFDGHLEEHCKELAHHYSRSGNIDKTVEYLHRAGQQAMRQSSVDEAIRHFNSALNLLQNLPDSDERNGLEFAIWLDLGPAVIAVKGYAAPEVDDCYTRALHLRHGAGTERQLFPVLLGLRHFHHVRGQMQTGRDFAECLLTLAQRVQDPSLQLEALQLNIPYVITCALVLVAEIDVQLRDGAGACEHAEAAVALADEYGYPFWGAWAGILQGAGMSLCGRHDEGVGRMRPALDAFRATGAELWCAHFLALLAEAQGRAGRPEVGLEVLAQARDSMAVTGDRMYQSELERLEGDLLLRRIETGYRADDDELIAQACFQRALATAQRQRSRTLELRAALSLGRLWRQQGRPDQARVLLGGICDAAGEGRDPDLEAVRALLAQLR
jgi:tetratricopeptide (TPR) repeat protein